MNRHFVRHAVRIPVAAVLFALCLLGSPAQATTLLRMEQLPALVEESRRALRAEVREVRYGYDERRLHSTWVTLLVQEPLYGELPRSGAELTIKIYGAPVEMEDGSRLFVEGTPQFAEGQRYLLLLRHDSPWGFTGVAGLFQGAFLIEGDDPATMTARAPVAHRTIFGDAGLAGWLVDRALTPQERRVVDGGRRLVPYAPLRHAIENLWHESGGRTFQAGGVR